MVSLKAGLSRDKSDLSSLGTRFSPLENLEDPVQIDVEEEVNVDPLETAEIAEMKI